MRGGGDHGTLARLERDLRVARAAAPQLLHPPVPLIDERPLADKRRGRAALDTAGRVVELTRREHAHATARATPLVARRDRASARTTGPD